MGAGTQRDHWHQDLAEKYVVWKLQSLAVKHGVAINDDVDKKFNEYYSYAQDRGVERSFNGTMYKKNPDKHLKSFFKELLERYPNTKFDFLDVEVELRGQGKKGDFIIVFDDGTVISVSLKNQSKHTGAQLCSGTWVSFLNNILFDRAGSGTFYNPLNKNGKFAGRTALIRNDIVRKLGYNDLVTIYEWMDKVNNERREYYIKSEEARFHYNVADQLDKDRKNYGKQAAVMSEKALRLMPQDKVKSRMIKITGLDCEEELLILSPTGYFCSLFNEKYQRALKRVNSEECELKYGVRDGLQGIDFSFNDNEGEIFSFYIPFTFNLNGSWWVDKNIPKYEGTRTYVGGVDDGTELQWQERKPKKCQQFATSVNTFLNYESVC